MMKLWGVALATCFLACAWAAEAAPPALKMKLVSISLFKNGVGFVTREGELPREQGAVLIQDLPAPALGTFWVYSPGSETSVTDVVGFESESVEQVEAISVAELIGANVGQTVELRLGEKETVRGKIVSVGSDRVPDLSSADPNRSCIPYVQPTEVSSLLVLQTDGGTMAVNKNAVTQVNAAHGPLKTSIERKKRTTGLRLTTTPAGGKGRIVVLYLAKGMTWTPSCAIDISDPRQARLTAKAEIINEIEDLDDVPVNFVTGFPNLKFADAIDPMAMRGNLAAFLAGISGPAAAAQGRLYQSLQVNAVSADEAAFPVYANGPQDGQAREELFFYERRGVTLKKGERGYYPLFTAEVPYQHVYEWKIGDLLDEQGQYRNREEPEKAEDVWHGIRLTNTTAVPWTTAPAMTMQGGQILGQDQINYTSVGAKTTVRITKALDVKAEQSEHETGRTRNAATFYGTGYDLVEVQGKLKVTNFKDKGITLSISKTLSGEIVTTTPAAGVEATALGLKKVNPKSVLTWELPIKPRDKVEIDYGYKLYVRD